MPLVTTASWAAMDRTNPDQDAEDGVLQLQAASLALSWGAQPATATCTYTAHLTSGQDIRTAVTPVPVGSYMEIQLGPYGFYGRCVRDVAVQGSDGRRRELQFVDLRDFLDWDEVFGVFNRVVDRLVETASGLRRVRRYRHLYPADWASRLWTETDTALTATQILNALVTAPTVASPWSWAGPGFLNTARPLELDFEGGVKLGAALLQVAERVGVQFTLAGKYFLKFRRKGVLELGETFPLDLAGNYVFPAGAYDTRQGLAESGVPTRVWVVGSPNLYQVLNLTLEPDWASGWSAYWDPLLFVNKIYRDHTPAVVGDVEDQQRWANAEAQARRMTVRDVVGLLGSTFYDDRLFGGRSRLDMPALGYIEELVFRAWKVPATILGRPARSWRLVNTAIAAVTHNAAGVMSVVMDSHLGIPESESGPGYAIADGIGINERTFRALNPRNFNLAHWVTANSAWGALAFQVDPDGGDGRGFVVFEQPVYRPDNLLVKPAATPQMAVLNANFTPTAPTVKASLTFEGEAYRRLVTAGFDWSRDATVTESGLRLERIYNVGGGAPVANVAYLDGETADAKADALAGTLLGRPSVVMSGSFSRLIQDGQTAVTLNGCYDRISVQLDRSGGLRETVDFTTERTWATFVPERFFDRNVTATRIFPGMERLRAEAEAATAYAQILASDPSLKRNVAAAFRGQPGIREANTLVEIGGADGATPRLKAGTPLWTLPATTNGGNPVRLAVKPNLTDANTNVFRGVVAREGEDPRGRVPVVASAPCVARVHGGAGGLAKGAAVGLAAGQDYLAAATSAETTVGLVAEAVPAGATVLVELTPAGGGGNAEIDWD